VIIRFVMATTIMGLVASLAGSAMAQTGGTISGEVVYRRACATCHSVDPGVTRSGPSLAGISGRAAGTAQGFRYSDAMASAPGRWTDAQLDVFLTNPRRTIPGNRMAFAGLASAEERAAVIQYLRTLR
jgi:cytochrome c